MKKAPPALLFLLVIWTFCLLASGIHSHDPLTWVLEVAPTFIVLPILLFTFQRFPLTPLSYGLITLHGLILMIGGHYTYAEVPIGFWMEHIFGFARNHYDRIGHFAQGFIPALIAREILLRRSPLVRGKWLYFIITCICLAISAFYELLEWLTAILGGANSDAFLGTQGDPWDTQWDMFFALIGSIISQLTLWKLHDRELLSLEENEEGDTKNQSLHR
ncbi:MAG: DUF2238 domain-containing protein [Verrucomicrobiota bacterium]